MRMRRIVAGLRCNHRRRIQPLKKCSGRESAQYAGNEELCQPQLTPFREYPDVRLLGVIRLPVNTEHHLIRSDVCSSVARKP